MGTFNPTDRDKAMQTNNSQSISAQNPQHSNVAASTRETTLRPTSAPLVDVYENEDEILVVADMPGARADSVAIRLEKEELSISANRDTDAEGQLLYGNRRDCEYRRTFLVPRGIDSTKITAEMNLGVLQVHMPKSAASKPRTITVNAGN
jgi:HSP20 family molecular chaperone IbpA